MRLGSALLVALSACGSSSGGEAPPPPPEFAPAPPTARDLRGHATETPQVTVIYLASRDNRLLMFDPIDHAFMVVAGLSCPEGPRGTPMTPHSMSVDKDSRAWVLYETGDMYWVRTEDGACFRSNWVAGQSDFEHFGMGFVRDPDGLDALYISSAGEYVSASRLGRIDGTTGRVSVIGTLPRGETTPELAGGDAVSLFAYYPGVERSSVVQIDRKTGKATSRWEIPALKDDGHVTAWAAASLRGKLYLFVTSDNEDFESNSRVFEFDPQTGEATMIVAHAPYAIVGAGVGLRAPVIVR